MFSYYQIPCPNNNNNNDNSISHHEPPNMVPNEMPCDFCPQFIRNPMEIPDDGLMSTQMMYQTQQRPYPCNPPPIPQQAMPSQPPNGQPVPPPFSQMNFGQGQGQNSYSKMPNYGVNNPYRFVPEAMNLQGAPVCPVMKEGMNGLPCCPMKLDMPQGVCKPRCMKFN